MTSKTRLFLISTFAQMSSNICNVVVGT